MKSVHQSPCKFHSRLACPSCPFQLQVELLLCISQDCIQHFPLGSPLLDQAKANPVGNVGYNPEKYKAVIQLAAEMGNWGKQGVNGIYKGFGAHFSFGTYVAQVADVSIVDGKVKVHKVYCAVDCGRVI